MKRVSKTEFKARALEILRSVEASGESVIITDHGKPKIEVKKLVEGSSDILEGLKGSVLHFNDPTEPLAPDDWELA